MAENTKIEWATHTLNPWRGCTKVAAGCEHCYADTLSKRNPSVLGIWGPNGKRVRAADAHWRLPVKWSNWARDGVCWICHGKRVVKSKEYDWEPCTNCDKDGKVEPYRARVFCASLADVFEDWPGAIVNSTGETLRYTGNGCSGDKHGFATDPFAREISDWHRRANMDHLRLALFDLIDATPNLDWLLLTKRPENIRRMWVHKDDQSEAKAICSTPDGYAHPFYRGNVWLLTSIATQADADKNIPELLKCRDLVPVLGVSAEPLVGPVDLTPWLPQLDWIIVGGESGHGARPLVIDWARSIVKQCVSENSSCFVKQLGANPMDEARDKNSVMQLRSGVVTDEWNVRYQLKDKKGGDWNEWPKSLRVRQFPALTP